MKKKDEALREQLLDCARNIMNADGLNEINIRSIAREAGVATGTVYNYFSGKDEILLALTEENWDKTLIEMKSQIAAGPFAGQLEAIYEFLYKNIRNSAGILMGSLGNAAHAGKMRMHEMHGSLKADILKYLEMDKGIDSHIWNALFTREEYAEFIIRNLMHHLRMGEPEIPFFIEIVKKTLYSE